MEILNKPEKIFLQIDDEIVEDSLDFNSVNDENICWCSAKIFDNDIPYFSKETLIEFVEWTILQGYIRTVRRDIFIWWNENTPINFTTNDLFEQFLKEKDEKI